MLKRNAMLAVYSENEQIKEILAFAQDDDSGLIYGYQLPVDPAHDVYLPSKKYMLDDGMFCYIVEQFDPSVEWYWSNELYRAKGPLGKELLEKISLNQ